MRHHCGGYENMISEEEWNRLKESERYGIIAKLFAKVNDLEHNQSITAKRIEILHKNVDGNNQYCVEIDQKISNCKGHLNYG